jgi:asparagine synthase (glutamine-hydrolysing)
VLSGLGGDEVFFGYQHYQVLARHPEWVERYGTLYPAFRRVLAQMTAMYGNLRGQERWQRFGYWDWCPPPLAQYLLFRGFYPEKVIGELMGMDEKTVRDTLISALPFQQPDGPSALANRFNSMELQRYLHDQLLRDSDVFSMAHSIELRVPYLDHRLVEALAAVDPANKVDRFVNKPRLLDHIDDDLLRSAARAPKKGFTFPLARWLKEQPEELESISLNGSPFDPTVVHRLWGRFRQGRLHWSRVWALVVMGSRGGTAGVE